MTDPNQPNPGNWNQNPYAPQQPQYGQQGQPPMYGQQGQPPMYGAPGQPGGGNGGSGKIVAIIVGALVVVIAIAVVAIFALRGDDDDDDNSTSSDTTGSAPLDDSFGDSDGTESTGGDSSLPSRWSGMVPASVEELLVDCHATSFNMNDVGTDEQREVDGTSCTIDGPSPFSGQQVDILAEDARIIYLADALNDDVPGASGTVFDRNGPVTVGVSDVESTGPSLFYLDSDSSVSVEIIEFHTEDEARDAAGMLGLL